MGSSDWWDAIQSEIREICYWMVEIGKKIKWWNCLTMNRTGLLFREQMETEVFTVESKTHQKWCKEIKLVILEAQTSVQKERKANEGS